MKKLILNLILIFGISFMCFSQEDNETKRNEIIMTHINDFYNKKSLDFGIEYQMIELTISEPLTMMDSLRLYHDLNKNSVAINMLSIIEEEINKNPSNDLMKQKLYWEKELDKIQPEEDRLPIDQIMNLYGWIISHHYVLKSESGMEIEFYEPILLHVDGRIEVYPF